MDKRYYFKGAQGETIENPTVSQLKEILSKDTSYWKSGSGDSTIELEGSDNRLLFFHEAEHGFFIMWHPDYEAPIDKNTSNIETVTHFVGGERFTTPSCCYFDSETTFNIIKHFIDTGEKSSDFEWVDIYSLEYDHGF